MLSENPCKISVEIGRAPSYRLLFISKRTSHVNAIPKVVPQVSEKIRTFQEHRRKVYRRLQVFMYHYRGKPCSNIYQKLSDHWTDVNFSMQMIISDNFVEFLCYFIFFILQGYVSVNLGSAISNFPAISKLSYFLGNLYVYKTVVECASLFERKQSICVLAPALNYNAVALCQF